MVSTFSADICDNGLDDDGNRMIDDYCDFVMAALVCVPCEIVIQYGAIYNNTRVCTDRPHLVCPSGQTPTFIYESRS